MTRASANDNRRSFTIADLNTDFDDEPRILDVALGEHLGFARPRKIREIIERNVAELLTYGGLPRRRANPGLKGGRPTEEVHLNEPQALLLCMWSNTAKAAEVRKMLIDVFMAYRRGKMDKPIHVREHDRRTSTKIDDAVRLKTSIDRLEKVTAGLAPAVPNFCAMVVNGEPVFVDVNAAHLRGERAVVIRWDGSMAIEVVETEARGQRPFGARTGWGPSFASPSGGTARESVVVIGKVLELGVPAALPDMRRQRVSAVTGQLREDITALLEAGPYNDKQIARELCCAPTVVKEVRRAHSQRVR